jgi:hypothetical protein
MAGHPRPGRTEVSIFLTNEFLDEADQLVPDAGDVAEQASAEPRRAWSH